MNPCVTDGGREVADLLAALGDRADGEQCGQACRAPGQPPPLPVQQQHHRDQDEQMRLVDGAKREGQTRQEIGFPSDQKNGKTEHGGHEPYILAVGESAVGRQKSRAEKEGRRIPQRNFQ